MSLQPSVVAFLAAALLLAACGSDGSNPVATSPASAGLPPVTTPADVSSTPTPPTTAGVGTVAPPTPLAPSTTLAAGQATSPSPATTAPFTPPPALPADPGLHEFSIDFPSGEFVATPLDVFLLHVDGDLWLHRGILTDEPAEPVRVVDLADQREVAGEGPGPNALEHVAGIAEGTVIWSDCCEPAVGNILSSTRPDAAPAFLRYGVSPTLSADRRRLATTDQFAVSVVDLPGGAGIARTFNDGAAYVDVWDVSFTRDQTSLVILYADGDGFALLPFSADVLAPGAPLPLDSPFDPRRSSDTRFAGHGPGGELALALAEEAATTLRFFASDPLVEVPALRRQLPAGAGSVRVARDGIGLLWVADGDVWYQPGGGTPRVLAGGHLAAWFAV